MRKSQQRRGEYLLPYLWERFNGQVEYRARKRRPEPVVGFCGLVSAIRRPWLDQLTRDAQCEFLPRSKFWGGEPHNPNLVREFFANIVNTDITFAMRGSGNFSMRFYQVLSCGRIPLWVDTDSVLPYAGLEAIPWERISIQLGEDERAAVGPSIRKFWGGVEDYGALQDEIRDLHSRFFTPAAFAAHLQRHTSFYLAGSR
jgi:hypothetical protein